MQRSRRRKPPESLYCIIFKRVNMRVQWGFDIEWLLFKIKILAGFPTNVKKATNNQSVIDLILSNTSSYVRSWRWLPLSKTTINNLINENKIFYSEQDGIINAVAILLPSEHFEKTLMITLISGNEDGINNIIKYFQNFALESDNERIQILTKINNFPKNNNLEKKYTFCLLEKQL